MNARERLLHALLDSMPAEWLPDPNTVVIAEIASGDSHLPGTLSGILDSLISAGVTMPAPICGSEVVICGNEFVCDQDHRHPPGTRPIHSCTDSVGTMRWRDSRSGPVVVSAESDSGWRISALPDGDGVGA